MKKNDKKYQTIPLETTISRLNHQTGLNPSEDDHPTNTIKDQFHSLNTVDSLENLRSSLPKEIQLAIQEWAASLGKLSWKLKRRAITRFSGSFADNFLAIVPELSEEEYDSLLLLGTTCMLEELEDGMPISEADQAKCYLDSIHDHHREMATAFLERHKTDEQQLH